MVRARASTTSRTSTVAIPRNRLTVITGLSGSGKSSLAFDTIYAEGQRRYVESLSAYARQFLGLMEKPDVDSIEGLSPAISIEQKAPATIRARPSGRSPRSTTTCACSGRASGCRTVPTMARRSVARAPSQIADAMLRWPEETRIEVLAPMVRGRKGEFRICSRTCASGASCGSASTARPTSSTRCRPSTGVRTTTWPWWWTGWSCGQATGRASTIPSRPR